ncbi:Glycoside hydrolase, family 31 [Metarhizium album ARSEF 1941]|uniref:alpha-glucosidase n=1 Tax=Metarhizium album (strain ARSEF 1941) TaxID=1081103 RepID=A0A0B2WQZ4_METAS|nr:Glycoside hydrolase, family 31 [Metarhizium album ARSEF 1941]KHN95917.1 Glycoside hydrolase, family 31 [Metarhizium album ARSEF 1941]
MVRMQVRADTRPLAQSTPYVGGRKGDNYRFTVLADGVLRYEWAPDGKFEDRPSAFAVHREPQGLLYYRVRESASRLEVITSRFHMTYNKQEFTPYGFFAVVPGYAAHTWRYGEPGQNLGGTCRTLDGADGRIAVGPGVASRDGFASIDDSRSMLFTEAGFVAPRQAGRDRVDGYLFCYGRDYREAVRALYRISGPQPVLPRWTLGNWWSRYYEYTAESYLELVDMFKRIRVPLAVGVIDMDWHIVKGPEVAAAGATGWTGYTWNRNLFPDPKAFIQALHDRKLRTALNEHPAEGIANYEDMYASVAQALNFDTSNKETIPFDCADPRFLKAYFDILIKHLEDDGPDFWWIDWQQGPYSRLRDLDPVWLLNHFHFLHNQRLQAEREPSERPIILSRYAGPGSQRYPIGFSGDTIVSWDSLAFQPEFTATASNIGYGWWSHDIGGHMAGVRDDDLTSRWVQLGVFSPIMRLHSTKTRWVCKEPWKLPAGSGQGPREVVTKLMRLRHRLVPYLHTMNARAAEEGCPLVQPMYWEYPDREEAYRVPNQYYFGTEMMVAPITTPQNAATKTGKVEAWLPPGRHIDFFTGVVYDGDRSLWLNRTLDNIPVLLKEGAIVPLDASLEPENGCGNPAGFEVVVVVGADGRFELLEEDDDEHAEARSDEPISWRRTPISFTQSTGTITIHPSGEGRAPRPRDWSIRLLGYTPAQSPDVLVNQAPVRADMSRADGASGLLIRVGEVPPGGSAIVKFGPEVRLSTNDPLALADPVVFAAQIPYETKKAVDRILGREGVTAAVRASEVDATDMDPDLRLVLKEYLLADGRV